MKRLSSAIVPAGARKALRRGRKKKGNNVSDSETADVASHNRHADRGALITPTITPVVRELSLLGPRLAGLSVESIGRFLRFIRLFAISLKGIPLVFSFHLVAPGRRKKSAYYSADATAESAW